MSGRCITLLLQRSIKSLHFQSVGQAACSPTLWRLCAGKQEVRRGCNLGCVPWQAASPAGSAEDKWRCFFADTSRYWDNRFGKRNERAPDFKHKDSGEALWMNDRRAHPLFRPKGFST